jgi:cis-3-alkyl-4-acyloxetan-2-one decarboxylase
VSPLTSELRASLRSPAERDAFVAPFAEEYPFESHFLDVDGRAYHYLDEGPREGEALVFVHGNPTWSFFWRHLVRELRPRYRCIAPDHIGCGLSDKPAQFPYRLENHVEHLEKLVLELGLRRATLVLHDWGGPIGLGVAQRHPERFERLVLFNTAAFTGGRAPWRIRICRTPGLGAFAVRRLNAFARLATHLAIERPERMTPAVRRGYLAPYDSFEHRIATLRFVQDIPLSSAHPSWNFVRGIEASLGRWRTKPVCVIWGERDWCFTPSFRLQWQERLPEAEVHVAERAGHYVVEDAREDVLAWVRSFLARHPLAP